MEIKFWGVRGSLPAPGASTVRYGGNTSCVSIELDGDKILVFDAGTGIREMGKALGERNADLYILLSHNHWDHIQGYPFFLPLFKDSWNIHAFEIRQGKVMLCSLTEQMDTPNFPSSACLPRQYECRIDDNPMIYLKSKGFNISRIATNHPGGGFAYRVEHNGRSVVYMTDNELEPPSKKTTGFDEFTRFCKNADILIHDSQYLENDMPLKHGWGHSLVSQACKLASAAEVKHLVLFHHDPDRTDGELDVIQDNARAWFKKNGDNIQCTVAFEGLTINI
ncbi:ribonuclease Z [bacterium BMS3Abin10]|nr:ribonuclease Z [bacterium BMS3Abin10]GBE39324.1 ribonuclease Z [bacterium BMS3Bbin08]